MSHWQSVVEYCHVGLMHSDNLVLDWQSHTLQMFSSWRWAILIHAVLNLLWASCYMTHDEFNQFVWRWCHCAAGSQSLKEAVVSVAAGLRHSLAVTGKLLPKASCACFHQADPNFLFCPQTQAVYISGEGVFWVMLREHSVHALSPHTSALQCPLWYQVS